MTLTVKRSDVADEMSQSKMAASSNFALGNIWSPLYVNKTATQPEKKPEFYGLRLDIVNWFFIDIIHIICDDLLGTSRELSDSRRNSTFFSFLVYYTRQRLSLHVTFESYSIGFLPFVFSAQATYIIQLRETKVCGLHHKNSVSCGYTYHFHFIQYLLIQDVQLFFTRLSPRTTLPHNYLSNTLNKFSI